jgi:hypothetical protein
MATDSETSDFLTGRVQALEETNKLFSPQGKEERELWVAKEFLAYVLPGTSDSAIEWVDGEPWDVLCLGARFQIKEIQEPGRRRHDEFKDALARAKTVTDPMELLQDWTPTTITLAEAMSRTNEAAGKFSTKYAPAVAQSLDLLIYLNLDASIVEVPTIGTSECVQLFHWRSVSVVSNGCAFVLYASESAPSYIRAAVGAFLRGGT